MHIYTVYDHPLDYPNHFVVRMFTINGSGQPIPDENIFLKHDSIEWIRERLLHCGLICMPRDPNDDPKIIESWL